MDTMIRYRAEVLKGRPSLLRAVGGHVAPEPPRASSLASAFGAPPTIPRPPGMADDDPLVLSGRYA